SSVVRTRSVRRRCGRRYPAMRDRYRPIRSRSSLSGLCALGEVLSRRAGSGVLRRTAITPCDTERRKAANANLPPLGAPAKPRVHADVRSVGGCALAGRARSKRVARIAATPHELRRSRNIAGPAGQPEVVILSAPRAAALI